MVAIHRTSQVRRCLCEYRTIPLNKSMRNRHVVGRAGYPLVYDSALTKAHKQLRRFRGVARGDKESQMKTGGSQMKVFVAGGTGAIGRPLIAELR